MLPMVPLWCPRYPLWSRCSRRCPLYRWPLNVWYPILFDISFPLSCDYDSWYACLSYGCSFVRRAFFPPFVCCNNEDFFFPFWHRALGSASALFPNYLLVSDSLLLQKLALGPSLVPDSFLMTQWVPLCSTKLEPQPRFMFPVRGHNSHERVYTRSKILSRCADNDCDDVRRKTLHCIVLGVSLLLTIMYMESNRGTEGGIARWWLRRYCNNLWRYLLKKRQKSEKQWETHVTYVEALRFECVQFFIFRNIITMIWNLVDLVYSNTPFIFLMSTSHCVPSQVIPFRELALQKPRMIWMTNIFQNSHELLDCLVHSNIRNNEIQKDIEKGRFIRRIFETVENKIRNLRYYWQLFELSFRLFLDKYYR